MDERKGDRHKSPRLAPMSMNQDEFEKINLIAKRLNLPVAWVARKLISEALADVDVDKLPSNIFRR